MIAVWSMFCFVFFLFVYFLSSNKKLLLFTSIEPIQPKEILAQKVGTDEILALFGASPDDADPNGKYRFFIDTAENIDPNNPFIAKVSFRWICYTCPRLEKMFSCWKAGKISPSFIYYYVQKLHRFPPNSTISLQIPKFPMNLITILLFLPPCTWPVPEGIYVTHAHPLLKLFLTGWKWLNQPSNL